MAVISEKEFRRGAEGVSRSEEEAPADVSSELFIFRPLQMRQGSVNQPEPTNGVEGITIFQKVNKWKTMDAITSIFEMLSKCKCIRVNYDGITLEANEWATLKRGWMGHQVVCIGNERNEKSRQKTTIFDRCLIWVAWHHSSLAHCHLSEPIGWPVSNIRQPSQSHLFCVPDIPSKSPFHSN